MIKRLLYAIAATIEVLVGLRFILRLIGANPDNGLVNFVYSASRTFVRPFAGILGQDSTIVRGVGSATMSVIDWTALIALAIIGLVVGALSMLVNDN